MSRADELNALADRVEALDGLDREVDEAICDLLFERSGFAQLAGAPIPTGCQMWWRNGQEQSALRYTASLDAAMTLVPDGCDWSFLGQNYGCKVQAIMHGIDPFWSANAVAATSAFALTAAALRAHAQEAEQ